MQLCARRLYQIRPEKHGTSSPTDGGDLPQIGQTLGGGFISCPVDRGNFKNPKLRYDFFATTFGRIYNPGRAGLNGGCKNGISVRPYLKV